jgi:hypothetical protein
LVLRRAGRELGLATGGEWRRALRTVVDAQAAVGRWYTTVGGDRPMTLAQWATTVDVMLTIGDREATGISGGGVDGIWRDAFDRSGRPRDGADALGYAQALRVFAQYGVTEYADRAFAVLLRSRAGSTDDAETQASLAAALAQRQLQLVQ